MAHLFARREESVRLHVFIQTGASWAGPYGSLSPYPVSQYNRNISATSNKKDYVRN